MQNVENNKELFSHDRKIEDLEDKCEFLLNENGKLRADYEILKSRFDALTKAVGREN
jgi:regulator of replication initiation timing